LEIIQNEIDMSQMNLPWVESPFFSDIIKTKNIPEEDKKLASEYYENGFIVLSNIFTNELIDQISSVYFCGNFGDPILNKDLPKMCLHLKEHKPTMRVAIHTNGGARNSDWWEELYHSLPENHRIVFALDGLEDTHHLYRIGTTYNGVIKNAKTFINAGGIAEWCFIKFKHNEHQENEARARANQSGFKYFTLKNVKR
jgi:sulfatase maturation enzyme AslB (radical SAM superfamily)